MSTDTTIHYNADENQVLADALFELLKAGEQTHDLETLEGMNPLNGVFIQVETNTVYSKSKNGEYVSNDQYWNETNMLAKQHRHWQRREITVRIMVDAWAEVKGRASINDAVQLVEIRYWWSKQNSSFTDNMMGHILFDPTKMSGHVELEWNNYCLDDNNDQVLEHVWLNTLGPMMALAEKCKNDNNNKMDELTAILSKVKV